METLYLEQRGFVAANSGICTFHSVPVFGGPAIPCALSERVHDHRPGHRCGWSD